MRRRGLVRNLRRLHTDNVNTLFLIEAIRYYFKNPQHPPAIGTQAEYDRLLRALPGPASSRR